MRKFDRPKYSIIFASRMLRGGFKYTWGPKGIRARKFWAATKPWNRRRKLLMAS